MSADRQEVRGLARGVVGAARVTAFGASIVAPAASVITVLVIVVSYAGFASPLVVLIAFAGSVCCALSIAEFARRVPSAGWAYTYNSRGLGQTAGFLTGWLMIFGYALFVPAGIALTSMYASRLLSNDVFHVTVSPSVLFVVIVAAVALVAYLGIGSSAAVDLLLVAGEMAVIAALAITILVKTGAAHYSLAVFSPASTPHGQFTEITNAMIYGIGAFAGFEAAAALGEEARDTRRSVPASIVGIVVVTGIFYLLVILAEAFGVGRRGIGAFIAQPSPLGYLTSRYWSPSALWVIGLVVVITGLSFVVAASNAAIRVVFAMAREQALPGSLTRLSGRRTPVVAIGCLAVITLLLGLPMTYAYGGARAFGYLAGAGGLAVVLVYLAGNIAVIRAFRTEFRGEFSFWRHLLIPATAAVIFLFPLWGILRPPAYTLVNLLPFAALGWLCLGVIVAAVLRARRPASFQTLGRIFMPAEQGASSSKDLDPGRERVDVVGSPYAPASRGMSSRVKVRSRRKSRVNANHQLNSAPTRLRKPIWMNSQTSQPGKPPKRSQAACRRDQAAVPRHAHRRGITRPFHPVWGDGTRPAARWNGGSAARGGRMSRTVRFQETLRRLAMIDEGFVEDRAGLGMGLAGTPALHPKTAALLQLGASVATGAPPVCVGWSTGRALAAGATDEEIADALLVIAPVTGLGRVVCAAPDVAAALGYDIAAALDDPG